MIKSFYVLYIYFILLKLILKAICLYDQGRAFSHPTNSEAHVGAKLNHSWNYQVKIGFTVCNAWHSFWCPVKTGKVKWRAPERLTQRKNCRGNEVDNILTCSDSKDGAFQFNPFTAMLAATSPWKRPIKAPNVESLRSFSPSRAWTSESKKKNLYILKSTVSKADLL